MANVLKRKIGFTFLMDTRNDTYLPSKSNPNALVCVTQTSKLALLSKP